MDLKKLIIEKEQNIIGLRNQVAELQQSLNRANTSMLHQEGALLQLQELAEADKPQAPKIKPGETVNFTENKD